MKEEQDPQIKDEIKDDGQFSRTSQELQDPNFNPRWQIKVMFAYMYFIQGVISAIPGTVPYIYPKLPDYLILGVFAFSNIPYSLKFIIAPILEKYFGVQYGKRKTWIFISQISASILLFIGSFFTSSNQQLIFAWFTVGFNLTISMQDISLDGLCLKQFKSRSRMSLYQAVFQNIGITVSGLLMLKTTSLQFAKSIGLHSPITELRWVIVAISISLLIPTLIIHLNFQETYIPAQSLSINKPLWKVFSIYRAYIFPSYRYFRVAVFLLFFYQGINFFVAGYNYKLIQKGFSRNLLNTIDNVNMIPQTILLFLFGMYSNVLQFKKSYIISLSLLQAVFIYLYIWFPTTVVPVAITSLLTGLLTNWLFMLISILIASFPKTGFTSMLYTMGASFSNAGRLVYIQTALLKVYPWQVWAGIGIIYTFLVIACIPCAINKIEQGNTKIDQILGNNSEEYIELQQERRQQEK